MRKVVSTGITALGIASASFALTVLNPFSASAQTETPSTTVPAPAEPTTPATPAPATPAPRDHQGGCADKGGDSGTQTTPDSSGSSSSASRAALRIRAARL